MKLDPNIAVLAAVTCGIGYLMIVAGIHRSALEWKRRRRLCASCGRTLERGVCRACRTG